jgi:anti-sigma factor RsiW
LGRPFDRHIDNKELNALVPSSAEGGPAPHGLSSDAIREVERHFESCLDCQRKVSKYRQLVTSVSRVAVSEGMPPGADCPKEEDIDWREVAAGLWPELKAKQILLHAALCDHCGPLLRAATSLDSDPTPHEEKLLAQLKKPSRPDPTPQRVRYGPEPRQLMRWLVPAVALIVIIGVLTTKPPSSPVQLSGQQLGEFAVTAYKQHNQGRLALDVRSDSQQTLNEWLRTKAPFSMALPTSPISSGESSPYRLEGARLLQVGNKTAAYIAYDMQSGAVGLMVTPDSVAVASGGVEVDFKKVSFHYGMVEGYKVVTWTVHGLTYALVSQEGNRTQQSCMVCHSAMRDRDLSHTSTPLAKPVWQ